MSYKSEFTKLFLKLLDKLDALNRERVLNAIDEVLSNPRNGSQLVFERQVLFKWRVGDYRLIYTINEKSKSVIFVVVDHRKRVYKRYGI